MKYITYNIGDYESSGADVTRREYTQYARQLACELGRSFDCNAAVIADGTSGSVTLRGFAPGEEPSVERDCYAIAQDVWVEFCAELYRMARRLAAPRKTRNLT
jgi:hypothetical protein